MKAAPRAIADALHQRHVCCRWRRTWWAAVIAASNKTVPLAAGPPRPFPVERAEGHARHDGQHAGRVSRKRHRHGAQAAKKALIQYRRGTVEVLDREGLKGRRQLLQGSPRWLRTVPQRHQRTHGTALANGQASGYRRHSPDYPETGHETDRHARLALCAQGRHLFATAGHSLRALRRCPCSATSMPCARSTPSSRCRPWSSMTGKC